MSTETILEREFKKYGIKPEDVTASFKKLLSKDEKWEILDKFFEKNEKKENLLKDKPGKAFTLVFKNKEDALSFSKDPSQGLLGFSRSVLAERGKDFSEYDLFFNLVVVYDESPKNKTPNVVVVRVV